MKGGTYFYNDHLYLTGDVNKGTFNTTNGTWTQQEKLNDYLVTKGVKATHCLDINNTTKLLELHYDDLDFEQGPAPYYYLKLKYPIHSVHPTQCLSIDPTTKQLEFNVNTDYFEFEANSKRTLKTKFDANGVEGPLFIDFSTRKLRAKYNDTLQINASQELCTTFDCKGLKTGSVLSLDSTTKLLDFKYDTGTFKVKVNDELDIKLADNSLSSSTLGLQVSSVYKTELQDLKTDTQTFKTQAETAKTQAETAKTAAEAARTQAETAKTQATTQATTATSQATIATTQATTATTQAGIATTQATAATAAAASATASAGSATASAGAAAASAVFCASINLIPGPQGPTGPQGPAGPQGPTGNPLSITWALPLSYNPTNTTASIDYQIMQQH